MDQTVAEGAGHFHAVVCFLNAHLDDIFLLSFQLDMGGRSDKEPSPGSLSCLAAWSRYDPLGNF